MSSADSGDGTAPSRKPWIWLSVLLTVVAAGLLFWALTIRSDPDSTQQELDTTQAELAGSREELDTTKQELDATKQEVEQLQSEELSAITAMCKDELAGA
jgi:hypothetical protein